jgi:hypothetical protein
MMMFLVPVAGSAIYFCLPPVMLMNRVGTRHLREFHG